MSERIEHQSDDLAGYNGPKRRYFKLAAHQRLLDIPPYHRLSRRFETGFKILRSPDGRPVCREHSDLRPGEVSLVLE